MAQTSIFCRTQEMHERGRAAGADLVNVKNIATKAADAWAREAAFAERREDKHRVAASLPAAGSLSEEQEDRLASENPDRGRAD